MVRPLTEEELCAGRLRSRAAAACSRRDPSVRARQQNLLRQARQVHWPRHQAADRPARRQVLLPAASRSGVLRERGA
eukprot:68649-Prymnesium_polylepis.1